MNYADWEKLQEKQEKIEKELWDKHPDCAPGEWVQLDAWNGKSCLDGYFAPSELRTIADIMDELKKRLEE